MAATFFLGGFDRWPTACFDQTSRRLEKGQHRGCNSVISRSQGGKVFLSELGGGMFEDQRGHLLPAQGDPSKPAVAHFGGPSRHFPAPIRAPVSRKSRAAARGDGGGPREADRKSTRLNSSHLGISYAVLCL